MHNTIDSTLAQISRATIEELSRQRNEPDWLRQLRLHAWDIYEQTPAPIGRRGDLGTQRTVANFKFQNLKIIAPDESRDQATPPAFGRAPARVRTSDEPDVRSMTGRDCQTALDERDTSVKPDLPMSEPEAVHRAPSDAQGKTTVQGMQSGSSLVGTRAGARPQGQEGEAFSLEKDCSGLIVQRNSQVVHCEVREDLKQQGVILTDLDTAVRAHPELVQKYFMTECVPMATSKYTALHAALWTGGFFLYVPQGVEIEDPILAQVSLDTPLSAIFSHTLVIAEPQSSVRFVQEYNSQIAGEDPALLSDVIEVYAQRESRVEFSNLQDLGQNVWQISNKNAIHQNDSSVTFVIADLGSAVTLETIGAGLQGNGSAAELVGVFFTDHNQRYVINSLSDHIGLSTNAETLVKGVLNDESRVEFDGMIRIRPGAQQTASFLSAHGLMLSKKARGEFIPGLEIAANEVSASHGATSGQIDEEQLFYLMVRGIPRPEAERIIVQGFFEPVLQRIPIENIRTRLRRSIVSRMSGGDEADTWIDAQERWEIEGVDEGAIHLDASTKEGNEEINLTEY